MTACTLVSVTEESVLSISPAMGHFARIFKNKQAQENCDISQHCRRMLVLDAEVIWGSIGVIVVLSAIAIVLGVTLTVNHPPWQGCDADYWKGKCRLRRGYPDYNNFLAVSPALTAD